MSLLTQLPRLLIHQSLRSTNLLLLPSQLKKSLRRKRSLMIGRTPSRMSPKLLLPRPKPKMFLSQWPKMRSSLMKKRRKKIPLILDRQPKRRLARPRKAKLLPTMLMQLVLLSIKLRARKKLKQGKLVRERPSKSVKHSRNKVDRNRRSYVAPLSVSWVT